MKKFILIMFLSCSDLFAESGLSLEKCANLLGRDSLKNVASLNAKEFNKKLEYLNKCSSIYPGQRVELFVPRIVDHLGSLENIKNKVAVGKEKLHGERLLKILRLCVNEGEPSCMHNYASLHNVNPESRIINYFPVDDIKFAKWTKKAAEAGDPRSMFNLIVRISRKPAPSGFEYNLEKAKAIAKKLKIKIETDYPQLKYMLPYIEKI